MPSEEGSETSSVKLSYDENGYATVTLLYANGATEGPFPTSEIQLGERIIYMFQGRSQGQLELMASTKDASRKRAFVSYESFPLSLLKCD